MKILLFIGLAVVILIAVGFAIFGLRKWRSRSGAVAAAGIALFMTAVSGGTYWLLGQPHLALREAQGLGTRDMNGLIPFLVERVRKEPGDLQAWIYLGRAYLTVGDANDAAKAYGRAVTVARLKGSESAELNSAYGTSLMAAAGGSVNDEAVAAFSAALKLDPKDVAARFFLGQSRAERGDSAGALALWQSLLADTPPNAPFRQTLVDQIALVTSRGGAAAAPDPRAMVANLAARLKADPNDAAGWRRLMRAYTVLGQPAEAKAALTSARQVFANDKAVLSALDADAKELKLN